MSEQWRGLHNFDRHEEGMAVPDWANCIDCDTACMWDHPCRCCLAAEVQAQTARADAAEEAELILRGRVNDLLVAHAELAARADAAEAKVQRVRSRHAPVIECVDCGEYATESCVGTHRTAEVCSLCLDMWEQAADYPCNEIRNLDGDS